MPSIELDKVAFHAKEIDAWHGERAADRDIGTLKVSKDKIEFIGQKHSVKITNLANCMRLGKWEILYYDAKPGADLPLGMRAKAVSLSKMTNGSAAIDPKPIVEALKQFQDYQEFACWWMGGGGGDIRQPLSEKGRAVVTGHNRLSIFHSKAPQTPVLEMDLADVERITTTEVSKKDQLFYVFTSSLKWGIGLAAVSIVYFWLTNREKLAIPLGLFFLYAILIGLAGALIISIPNFLRARNATEFAFHKKDGNKVFICVRPKEVNQVRKIFQPLGVLEAAK